MFTPRKTHRFLFVLLIVVLMAGCTYNPAKQKFSSSPAAVDKTTSQSEESAAAPNTAGQTGQGTLPDSPKLIKTAAISIEVGKGEFQKKFDEVKQVAEKVGGYTTDSSASRDEGEMTSGKVTLRVPSKQFDKAITIIKKIGTLDSVNISGQDVTEEYVDLESRLKNYESQETQLLAIMTKAQTVEETLKVQEQLTSVRGEIEVIKGRMQYLDKLVDFSTITVTIQEPGAVVPESGSWGFIDALRTAAKAFLWTINGIIVVLGATLPILILLVLFVWSTRMIIKRRSLKKTQ